MVREMSKAELKKWQEESEAKCARILGKSTYTGSDVSELMESGASGRVFKKYKAQEKAKADQKALLASLDKGISTQDRVKVFKSLAERYGASLAPRMSWVEIEKVVKSTYSKYLEEAGIKDISVPSYHRYETTGGKEEYSEKKVKKDKKQTYFTEADQKTMLSFCEGLKTTLQRQVSLGKMSQKEADSEYQESLSKVKKDYGIAKKELNVPQRFLDNPHNDKEDLLDWWWKEESGKEAFFEGMSKEEISDIRNLSDTEFQEKYPTYKI